jgi:hypothetical protein
MRSTELFESSDGEYPLNTSNAGREAGAHQFANIALQSGSAAEESPPLLVREYRVD